MTDKSLKKWKITTTTGAVLTVSARGFHEAVDRARKVSRAQLSAVQLIEDRDEMRQRAIAAYQELKRQGYLA